MERPPMGMVPRLLLDLPDELLIMVLESMVQPDKALKRSNGRLELSPTFQSAAPRSLLSMTAVNKRIRSLSLPLFWETTNFFHGIEGWRYCREFPHHLPGYLLMQARIGWHYLQCKLKNSDTRSVHPPFFVSPSIQSPVTNPGRHYRYMKSLGQQMMIQRLEIGVQDLHVYAHFILDDHPTRCLLCEASFLHFPFKGLQKRQQYLRASMSCLASVKTLLITVRGPQVLGGERIECRSFQTWIRNLPFVAMLWSEASFMSFLDMFLPCLASLDTIQIKRLARLDEAALRALEESLRNTSVPMSAPLASRQVAVLNKWVSDEYEFIRLDQLDEWLERYDQCCNAVFQERLQRRAGQPQL